MVWWASIMGSECSALPLGGVEGENGLVDKGWCAYSTLKVFFKLENKIKMVYRFWWGKLKQNN